MKLCGRCRCRPARPGRYCCEGCARGHAAYVQMVKLARRGRGSCVDCRRKTPYYRCDDCRFVATNRQAVRRRRLRAREEAT